MSASHGITHARLQVYGSLKQLDICYATPTHRGTTGDQCRLRTPEPIPSIVTTTRNYVVKQTGVAMLTWLH